MRDADTSIAAEGFDVAPGAPHLEAGSPQPLGANWTGRGTNFAVFSAHAEKIELCLFDASGREEIARLELPSRTGDLWHGFLPARFGGPGLQYGYRVHGPYDPSRGHRYNPNKLLLDPCAQSLRGDFEWHPSLVGAARGHDDQPSRDDSAPHVPRCEVVDGSFDWGKVRAPNVPWRDTIVYEMHVKGFTQRHPDVPAELRGKYLGLAQPVVIDYLKRLGITTVELMPVQAFITEQFLDDRGLRNYWGYNSLAWFAPEPRYAVEDAVPEFKTMVRALHQAGLEVVLDVVLNHTAEGNENGPTLNLRGFDNAVYYRLPPDSRAHYVNHSGCGNTTNFDEPAVRALIIDCLRYWATEMRVDGFRFDLATILGRDATGYNRNSRLFGAMRADPALAYLKMIAEPWDLGPAGYQLGHFPSGWSEWNDRYRDTLRAFWRGDRPVVGTFVERFAGSSDLFRGGGRKPTASVNYVAAHDGFTLQDTVSYALRHNEANLEHNRDGHAHNLSANYGVEGPTDDPTVLEVRARQARNLLASVFLSQGVPMLLAGDEFGRTQRGNNNAYCQDNELSWIDWSLCERNASLVEFVRGLIDLRKSRLWLRRDTFLKGTRRGAHAKDVTWLHPSGREMTNADWNDSNLRSIAVHMNGAPSRQSQTGDLLVVFNADEAPVAMTPPPPPDGSEWAIVFDTAAASAIDGARVLQRSEELVCDQRSTVLLESRAR
ncbi:MAG TPA: glycogen debranching protein GlgX [Steroidobacteraceae bacterium]|nr:glycogen debranching protein GlgX [Steroidobacteraceae bacterium]